MALVTRFPFRLIGVLLLAAILYTLDLGQVVDRLRQIGPRSLALAALAFVALLAFRCWRWHLLLGAVGVAQPARRSVLSCNGSVWLGMATPGRVGEFRRAADLARREALGLGEASALVLFDLSLDLFAFALFAVAGGLFLHAGPGSAAAGLLFAGTLGIGLAMLALVRWPIALALRWLPASARIPGVGALMPRLKAGLVGRPAARIAVLTAGVTIAYVLMMMALTASMAIDHGLVEAMAMVGIAGVAGAVPITYFGLGTRDIALIWYFAELGQDKETAVAVSFAFLLAQLIGIAVSLAASVILPHLLPAESQEFEPLG